jgi:tetratricopeptide (TPR) repeat protein
MQETRGQGDFAFLDRELDRARREYERAVLGALTAGRENADLKRLANRLAQQLLDHPDLAEDPAAADLESMASALLEEGLPAEERELGERVLSVLQRLRGMGGLSTPRVVPVPVPEGLDLPGLLEAWPETPVKGSKDLLHRALLEYHKGRRGGGQARRRGVSALVDLAVATSWDPLHAWRLALLEQARDFSPEVADVYFQIARHLKAYGELAGARRACRRAVDLDPRAPEPLVLLAGFLEFAVRPREALDVYERVLRLRKRFGFEGRREPHRPSRKPRRSLSGRYRLPEIGLRRASLAALEGCVRLRALLGRYPESLEAMLELVREVPGDTRQLRGLFALCQKVGLERELELLGKELVRRGGSPGGVLPLGFSRVSEAELAGWLKALLKAGI